MRLNAIEERLVKKYSEIIKIPTWSFSLYPSIPFVGNQIAESRTKVLSYASAENLSYAFDNDFQPNEESVHNLGDKQLFRSRYFYEQSKQDGCYFPFVHITPFNDGSQLIVTRFVLTKMGYDESFSNNP
ncbi:MAG: hypothetical protein K8R79_05150 [Calditrichales bacterium]|nr:hypothetical protein [Calditrichales bacterium]